jgi:hypothetical protein
MSNTPAKCASRLYYAAKGHRYSMKPKIFLDEFAKFTSSASHPCFYWYRMLHDAMMSLPWLLPARAGVVIAQQQRDPNQGWGSHESFLHH